MKSNCLTLICVPLLLADLVMALVGNGENKQLQFEVLGREVAFSMIGSNRADTRESMFKPGSGRLPILVIETDEQWEKLFEEATTRYRVQRQSTLKKPDFVKQMVVGVGTFHAGGITGQGRSREAVVSRILETKDKLLLYLRDGEERVGGGCVGEYFFYLVKLAKSDKKIELIDENDRQRN